MPNLPAIIRPVLPWVAHRLELRKQDAQQRDQGGLSVPPRQAFDVERADSGLTRAELKALLQAAKAQGAYEELRDAREYERAWHREEAQRRHEKHMAYMGQRERIARRFHRLHTLKVKAIVVIVVSGAVVILFLMASHREAPPYATQYNSPPVIIEHHYDVPGHWRYRD